MKRLFLILILIGMNSSVSAKPAKDKNLKKEDLKKEKKGPLIPMPSKAKKAEKSK